MTPERWLGLAALLIEARDWVMETDPGALDAAVLDDTVDVCVRQREQLMREGAR